MLTSRIKNKESKKSEYPKLMKNKKMDFIVLFSGPGVGTVVYTEYDNGPKVGNFASHWQEDMFKETNLVIILEEK
jgi:hypothetical protein